MFQSLSVLDNLMLGPRDYSADNLLDVMLRPGHVANREQEALSDRAYAILDRTGLAGIAHSPIGDITFGQQKLVGVARALMNNTQCLLLDEPMAGVEGQAYALIQRVVPRYRCPAVLRSASSSITSPLSAIFAMRASLCFPGKVLARGSIDALIADPQLTELYFGT